MSIFAQPNDRAGFPFSVMLFSPFSRKNKKYFFCTGGVLLVLLAVLLLMPLRGWRSVSVEAECIDVSVETVSIGVTTILPNTFATQNVLYIVITITVREMNPLRCLHQIAKIIVRSRGHVLFGSTPIALKRYIHQSENQRQPFLLSSVSDGSRSHWPGGFYCKTICNRKYGVS